MFKNNPSIKSKSSPSVKGRKTIVQLGMNSKTGIKPKKTPTSTNANSPIATVATIGKNSFWILSEVIEPLFIIRLASPPDVPLAKM